MIKTRERIMRYVFLAAAGVSVLAVLLICIFLFANGFPAIREIGLFSFLFGANWAPNDVPAAYGILPMILGSLYITAGAVIVGVPIGVLTSVFMVYFCPQWLYRILKPAIHLLAGIPSVVFGFFGIVIIVPWVQQLFGASGSSILTASILLGIMILPTVISTSESALQAVPKELYQNAVALGASKERAIFGVVLKGATSGIMTAIVLGLGRAVGETMAVIMVAGNQAVVRLPTQVLTGVRTLTANIVLEMGYASGLHRSALIATGVVLFVFILLIRVFAELCRKEKR